jgi:hypothetical protein
VIRVTLMPPRARNRHRTGVSSAALIRSTTGCGVPDGTTMPNHGVVAVAASS